MNPFNIPSAELIQHIINGLTLGAIYSLIALGYTMVYGILKFINFAHGEILMIGTYAGYYFYFFLYDSSRTGSYTVLIFLSALLFAVIISALLGIVIERIAYKPLRKAPRLAPLLSAIGVSIILVNSAALLFGTQSKKFEHPFDNTPVQVLGSSITPVQIMIIAVGIIMMVGLKLFIDRSRLGKAMRAASQNQSAASLMGINVNFIVSLTFAIGSALAAVAGILTALEFKVYPTMGQMAGLKAFIAAVVGGIGSINGAMLGGILLGLLETFGVVILGIPQGLKDTIAFSVLILILLLRPSGILMKNIKEKGIDMLDFILLICIYTGIFAISALGLNLVVGYTGLLSLYQAAFLAIGAYSTAIFMTGCDMGFWQSMFISGIITSLAGLLIGIPALRLKGDYLAIATLGFGEIVKNIILNWDSVTKGPMGINAIPGLSIAGITLTYMDKYLWAIIIWIFVALSYYLIRKIIRSRTGRALEAIREDEIAASAMGINTSKYKIGAFTLGAFLGGIAGSLFACFNQSVAPLTFDFMMSVMLLCMAVLGGLGNSFATIIGAVIIVITSELPRLLGISHIIPPQINQILFGLILIIMMIYRPQGLIGRVKINYAKIMKEEIPGLEK